MIEEPEPRFCGICGAKLSHTYMVGSTISGHISDYVLHQTGTIVIDICSECTIKMREIDEKGYSGAWTTNE
jgi:hypothetical protein